MYYALFFGVFRPESKPAILNCMLEVMHNAAMGFIKFN